MNLKILSRLATITYLQYFSATTAMIDTFPKLNNHRFLPLSSFKNDYQTQSTEDIDHNVKTSNSSTNKFLFPKQKRLYFSKSAIQYMQLENFQYSESVSEANFVVPEEESKLELLNSKTVNSDFYTVNMTDSSGNLYFNFLNVQQLRQMFLQKIKAVGFGLICGKTLEIFSQSFANVWQNFDFKIVSIS